MPELASPARFGLPTAKEWCQDYLHSDGRVPVEDLRLGSCLYSTEPFVRFLRAILGCTNAHEFMIHLCEVLNVYSRRGNSLTHESYQYFPSTLATQLYVDGRFLF